MKIYIDDRNISLPDNVVSEGEDFQVFIETKMNRELTENVVVQQQGAKSRNHGVTYMIIGQCDLGKIIKPFTPSDRERYCDQFIEANI